MNNELKPEMIQDIEKIINWILPGCQLFYRDTDANVNVEKSYPIGSIIRAGFFVDVTARTAKPTKRIRYIIGSAHCAKLHEVNPDEDMKRWRLCTLHFNSYFKVMDIYEKGGVTQIFLLHIPYQSLPFFMAEHSFNLIQGASQINLVEVTRRSLDTKLEMDVFPDTSEPALLERMEMPIGIDEKGNPLPLDFMIPNEGIESLSNIIRKLGEDLDSINYPTGMAQPI